MQPLGLPVVYLVDDEDVVRDAVAWLLRSRRLLSEGFASAEAFEAMLDGASHVSRWPLAPCCLLLDLRMGGASGLVLFDRLVARGLATVMPVIFLTGHADVPTAVAAVKRGAFDFVEKPFSNNGLVDRVELAITASAAALTARAAERARAASVAALSERERDVMRAIGTGLANKQIAAVLHLSVRTVEVHRARVFDKLGVRSAVELANFLHRGGAEPEA
ncbi:MAG: LuxR C-terminal-related transcriptional regulator [Caldimonas sp.]